MYCSLQVLLYFTSSISCGYTEYYIKIHLAHKSQNFRIEADSVKYAILPVSKAHSKGFFKGRKDAPLNRNDFAVIDQLVHRAVQSYNAKQKSVYESWLKKLPSKNIYKGQFFIDLLKYKRQYFCAFNARGEKLVWVNCFCGDEDYWKTAEVFVFDGGNCYFNLMINLATKQVSGFETNGVA